MRVFGDRRQHVLKSVVYRLGGATALRSCSQSSEHVNLDQINGGINQNRNIPLRASGLLQKRTGTNLEEKVPDEVGVWKENIL